MTGIHTSSIMLIEDNPQMKESIVDLLALHGFKRINAFSNGMNALAYFQEKNSDLIILDIELPGMGGFELLQAIRSINRCIPVVMMSSRDDKNVILKACESGANTFFPKPFDSEMFCRKIEDLLNEVDFFNR